MPRLQHAVITVGVFYRAGRDSDAVRACRVFRRFGYAATRTKRPAIGPRQGFENPPAGAILAADHPSRSP